MSTRTLQQPAERGTLRVLKGRRRLRRPSIFPWMIMALVGTAAFLGLGFARTSLDKSAFELAELNKAIAEQTALNRRMRLEIARLESPARIAPLAEEMGLVIPDETRQIFADLNGEGPSSVAHSGRGQGSAGD